MLAPTSNAQEPSEYFIILLRLSRLCQNHRHRSCEMGERFGLRFLVPSAENMCFGCHHLERQLGFTPGT